MLARIKMIWMGLLYGKSWLRYYLVKPYVKWTAGIALLNGTYTIGLYDGVSKGMTNITEISQLLLTKLQMFWLWIYNLNIIQFTKVITHNIAYYSQLSVNIIFVFISIVVILFLFSFFFWFRRWWKTLVNENRPGNEQLGQILVQEGLEILKSQDINKIGYEKSIKQIEDLKKTLNKKDQEIRKLEKNSQNEIIKKMKEIDRLRQIVLNKKIKKNDNTINRIS